VAEGGRTGELRYLGEVDTSDAAMRKLIAKLANVPTVSNATQFVILDPVCALWRITTSGSQRALAPRGRRSGYQM